MIALAFKNHYERLGVSPQSSEAEIRRAYRRLARKHHPDVAVDKVLARDLFILINEAHNTLVDPERRRDYDAELHLRERFRRPLGNGTGHKHTHSPIHPDNGIRTAAWEYAQENPGRQPASAFSWKQKASSTSRPRTRKRPDLDTRANIEIPLEDALNGALHTVTIECEAPGGQHHRLSTYHVRIPPGVTKGQQLRLADCGLRDNLTGEAGDLYLNVHYARHKRFRLLGTTLFTEVEIPVWDAALGALMCIPTLDGKANLHVPQGAQPGQRFTLKGYGMPTGNGQRGDLLVALKLTYPAAHTARQKAHWESLARAYRI